MSMTIKHSNFQTEVLQETKPVLIDFYANWCMPCKMLSPVIEKIAKGMPDVKVCKVNIDEEPELAQQFQVMSIPTLVVMKDGKMVGKSIGVRTKNDIINMLKK
jgi:thioredoxin 1